MRHLVVEYPRPRFSASRLLSSVFSSKDRLVLPSQQVARSLHTVSLGQFAQKRVELVVEVLVLPWLTHILGPEE